MVDFATATTRLMLSVSQCPKVITLSGTIVILQFIKEIYVCRNKLSQIFFYEFFLL
jgi:hypothetical protein